MQQIKMICTNYSLHPCVFKRGAYQVLLQCTELSVDVSVVSLVLTPLLFINDGLRCSVDIPLGIWCWSCIYQSAIVAKNLLLEIDQLQEKD